MRGPVSRRARAQADEADTPPSKAPTNATKGRSRKKAAKAQPDTKSEESPKAKAPSKKQLRDEERDSEMQMAEATTGTSVRAEVRKQLGKEKRLEETARRRGIQLGGAAAARSRHAVGRAVNEALER